MGNRTNYGTGRMTVDNRQKNERSRSGNPYSSHVKAGKHAGTVYNFKRKSRIRKSLTRLPILLEFIHKYIFLNFVSFYNGLNSNVFSRILYYFMIWCTTICPYLSYFSLFRHFPRFCAHLLQMKHQRFRKNIPENENFSRRFLSYHSIFQI